MRYFFFLLILAMSSSVFAQEPPIGPGVSQSLAQWRAARYSDVRYKLNLTLEKMSPVLKGTMEIRVNLKSSPPYEGGVAEGRGGSPLVLDWRKIKGHEDKSTISNVSVNGKSVERSTSENHPVGEAPTPLLRKEGSFVFDELNDHLVFRDGVVAGENVIKLEFTSPILTSGSAITRYVDKEDGAEYIYSLFVPSDASTAFPVFDQPDLKARFQLFASVPKSWKLITNSYAGVSVTVDGICGLPLNTRSISELFNLKKEDPAKTTSSTPKPTPTATPSGISTQPCEISDLWSSDETKPISTYVFAFAAGPWERVAEPPALAGGKNAPKETSSKNIQRPTGITSTPPAYAGGSALDDARDSAVYVRKSQAEKFKPHAAETFRLMREGVKYFEGYFDYKFPFPKYDLVLIPEFPFGGMEHAGATFVRESAIIFPTEPTKSDYINRATLIFHETAHQWFGDTVTMKWFDDLWLKEGFANFMAYKALEKIMPEANAWKVFYERIKQPAYATDSTKGTTPIYQKIDNLSAAKSAYGNIVYNKAPAFLRQAEFYLGEDKFQTAVRAFLKEHEFGNAGWEDLVREFETASKQDLNEWAGVWVKQRGLPIFRQTRYVDVDAPALFIQAKNSLEEKTSWPEKTKLLVVGSDDFQVKKEVNLGSEGAKRAFPLEEDVRFVFPNYGDYGYGIFLLDEKSRDYVLKNIRREKDPFLRSMMWGALWDSVREGELDPKKYVELAIRNLPAEQDETIVSSILGRVSTAMNYYMSDKQAEPPALAGGRARGEGTTSGDPATRPPAYARGSALGARLEAVLIDRMRNAPTLGQRITFYRAFLNIASSENARTVLKRILARTKNPPVTTGGSDTFGIPLKTKDRFDIVTRLAILGDPEAPKLLADLEKTETSDDAKRYAYAAHAAFATKENREKFWNDFVNNKEISESWIEAAVRPFNSIEHDDLSLPYLERALKELPNLKRDRKIFFVNGWLGAFIGGQRSEEALDIVNKFLADNPKLDNDLRLKILENVDTIERAVKIRANSVNKK